MKKYIKILSLVALSTLSVSCSEDSLDAVATTLKPVDDVKNLNDVSMVVRGALDRLSNQNYYGRSLLVYGELYADNAYANGNSGRYLSIGSGRLTVTNDYVANSWDVINKVISSSNLAINKRISVSKEEEEQYNDLLGQAYFYRALAHFDLLRYWGQQNVEQGGLDALGVPYIKIFHPEGETIEVKRESVRENLKNLYSDLDEAIKLFGNNDKPNTFYANKWTAKALKARIALYFKDYDQVLSNANEIINSGKYKVVGDEDYVKSWKNPSSDNWLFAISYTTTDELGNESISTLYQNTGYGDIVLRKGLLNTIFDDSDIRGKSPMILKDVENRRGEKWDRIYGKYPRTAPSVYSLPLFRYEEIILDKAEALYYKNQKQEAIDLINNEICANRNAKKLTDLSQDILIKEWRKEFLFEGMRFTTLTRNGLGIESRKVPAGDFKLAFPIPRWDRNNNPNIEQNKGY
ncbi:RagB/SusD family nutrient uptake outer membrane protein [Ornithobacterium rhinotracheale]